MVKKKKESSLTKNQQVIIAVAIIGAIGAFVGGPTYNSMWEDRAIIEVSFGFEENFPMDELQFDGTNYFIDIIGINRGNSQTFVTLTAKADGASLSYNLVEWNSLVNQKMLVRTDETPQLYRIYVNPVNPEGFTIEILVPTTQPLIDEVYWLFPLTLHFEFIDEKYTLTRSF